MSFMPTPHILGLRAQGWTKRRGRVRTRTRTRTTPAALALIALAVVAVALLGALGPGGTAAYAQSDPTGAPPASSTPEATPEPSGTTEPASADADKPAADSDANSDPDAATDPAPDPAVAPASQPDPHDRDLRVPDWLLLVIAIAVIVGATTVATQSYLRYSHTRKDLEG